MKTLLTPITALMTKMKSMNEKANGLLIRVVTWLSRDKGIEERSETPLVRA